MVDLSAIGGIVSSLNAARQITQAMAELRDAAMIQGKIIELQGAILDAQSKTFAAHDERTALIQRIGVLEEEMARMKAWDSEKQRYKLQAVSSGAFVYAPKPEMQGTEPPHWLCQQCYEQGNKSIMQNQGRAPSGRDNIWKCNRCKNGFTIGWGANPKSVADGEAGTG